MFDMFHGAHGWGMSGGMGFFAILFWLVIIAAAIFIAKGLVAPGHNLTPPPTSDSPLTIIEKRYASGEIDQETFKRMKYLLTENDSEQ